jgi:peptide-methionine (S)-S-oxide reductase
MKKVMYLAGGCFWGLEELLRKQHGVVDTEVDYMGGLNENPTYENHPGHAETVMVTYDNSATSHEDLLEYFFKIHNSTTLNQQGNDVGSSYRSAIFTSDEQEKVAIRRLIGKINSSSVYPSPVVTTTEPLSTFWKAEEYHQGYLQKNPGGYTCHFERNLNFN